MTGLVNLASYVPPVPIPPVPPNFAFCSDAYGTGLTLIDAMHAGGLLPQGTMPVTYSVGDSESRSKLPFLISFDDVWISLDVSGPNHITEINLIPNEIRGMAAHLANTCVRHSGVGGFVTKRIQGLVDFVTDPKSDIENPPYPDSTGFLTLTMSDAEQSATFPGDYDPQIARFLRQAELDAYGETDPFYRPVIAGRIGAFARTEARMHRLETEVPWWGEWLLQGNKTAVTSIQLANMTTEVVATARRKRRAAGLLH